MFNFSRNEQIVVMLLVVSIAAGATVLVIKKTRGFSDQEIVRLEKKNLNGKTITVSVVGAVEKPQDYNLPMGSRVFEAILAAGGPLPQTDLDRLNLAVSLEDKTILEVPYREGTLWTREPKEQPELTREGKDQPELTREAEEQHEPAGFVRTIVYYIDEGVVGRDGRRRKIFASNDNPPPLVEGEIDLNSASQEDLIRLPKIGPALANRIIEYRKTKGPFAKIEDITQVRGIGEATLAGIKKYIRVQSSPSSEEATSSATVTSTSPESDTASIPATGNETGAKININSATLEELVTLPKIGPSLAQRIIDYRISNGPFEGIDDLVQVRGIGEKTLSDLKTLITVGDDQ